MFLTCDILDHGCTLEWVPPHLGPREQKVLDRDWKLRKIQHWEENLNPHVI